MICFCHGLVGAAAGAVSAYRSFKRDSAQHSTAWVLYYYKKGQYMYQESSRPISLLSSLWTCFLCLAVEY